MKSIIEGDIRSEMSAMIERLNSVAGSYSAMLEHDIKDKKGDLERIAEIVATVE